MPASRITGTDRAARARRPRSARLPRARRRGSAARPSCSRRAIARSSTSPARSTRTTRRSTRSRQLAGERADDLAAALIACGTRLRRSTCSESLPDSTRSFPARGDPRPGAGGVRSRRHRPVPRPALPPGAARGQARSDGDRDQREPGVRPVGGGCAGPAGVRRPCRAPRPPARGRGRSAIRRPQPSHARRRDRRRREPDARARRGSRAELGARALALDAVATELARCRRDRRRVDQCLRASSCARVGRRRHFVRARAVPLLLLDLAVPRDLDPAITSSTAASSTTSTTSRPS